VLEETEPNVNSLTGSPYASIAISVLVVAFVCFRQLQTRSIREERGLLLYVLVFALGVLQAITFLQKHSVSALAAVLVIVSLVIGLGLGAVRGRITHLWRANDKLLRRGNAWTIAVWVVGLGIHLGIELFSGQLDRSAEGFASSTLLLYIALSLGMQRFVLLSRAKSIARHPDQAPSEY
jgi:hypothetical protein